MRLPICLVESFVAVRNSVVAAERERDFLLRNINCRTPFHIAGIIFHWGCGVWEAYLPVPTNYVGTPRRVSEMKPKTNAPREKEMTIASNTEEACDRITTI